MSDPERRRVARWATMQDVARAAGVSTITVSRVLRTPAKVRAETRGRVEAAVRALGYVPDGVAGSLSSRESRLVAAVVSTLAGSIFASTLDGLAEGLRRHDHALLLGSSEYSPAGEEALVAAGLARRPDGLVLTGDSHSEPTRRMLAAAGLPVVELWALPATPIDMAVGFCNRAAGHAITRFLQDSGRRRIGFIGGARPGDSRGPQRYEGYRAALEEVGQAAPRSVIDTAGAPQVERGARALAALLERWPDTQAVFCASDVLALGALSEARRRGLAVPGELALAGFGDFDFAGEFGLGLTTVRIPGREIGAEAAELLMRWKQTRPPEPVVVDLGFQVVRRATA